MDRFEKEAWEEFISKPFDPTFDWQAIAANRRREAALAASGKTNVVQLFPKADAQPEAK